jgi:hypothetical protein
MPSTDCAEGGITASSEIARLLYLPRGGAYVAVSSWTNDFTFGFTFGAIFCRQSLFFAAAEA